VPASGYFEWTGPKNDRQPHYFTRVDGQPMGLAGLWIVKRDTKVAAALLSTT
jgi:putative SOS response-associated peptidase YedK